MPRGEPDPETDVLRTPPPRFSPQDGARIAASIFGVTGEARALGSERDQNFLIDDGTTRIVLKISNAGEDPGVLDMETEAALHALRTDPDLPVAAPIPIVASGPDNPVYRAHVAGDHATPHLVRGFRHMPGRASVDPTHLDRSALWEYGITLARLGRALRSFFHPAGGRVLLWDVQHAGQLRGLLTELDDPALRAMSEASLDRFDAIVAPAWPALRSQIVHGDLTLDNALVDERGRVSGIVDFGDMSHTALLCDLSSGLASVLAYRDPDDVFASAAAVVDGYQRITPLEETERALLGDLLTTRLATTVLISAWRVRRHPENAAYITGWDDEVRPLLGLLHRLGPEEVSRRLSGRPTVRSAPPPTFELAARRARITGPALAPLSYDRPLHLVAGDGAWVFDADGRRYLDAYNNVPVVGHAHPRVTEAIARQARTLNTNMRYLHDAVIELSERLIESMPEGSGLDTVMVVNSGSEANDLAWRIVTQATGRTGAIVTANAYHGISAAITDLSPEEWRDGRQPPHVETIVPPDRYRRPVIDHEPHTMGNELAEAAARLATRDRPLAASIVDAGFTSDGILTPDAASFQELVRRTHEAGGLFIADEVQVGHGRLGRSLWGFAAFGVVPDVVTLGKPMGNGHPVAAVITRSELVQPLASRAEFFSTFGGNPVAAQAALAVLDVVEDQDLIAHAGRVGAALRAALEELARQHGAIGDVRGGGLLIGVDLVRDASTREPDPLLAGQVANGLRERGVLVGTTGPADNVLKIRPPLVFDDEHAALLIDAFASVLAGS
jgi:4-aminobutyrate aminotransferase-like enzyme/Ser/Thr protein kinase RdoA (MazF antagonist)